jgi:hypothetical protein
VFTREETAEGTEKAWELTRSEEKKMSSVIKGSRVPEVFDWVLTFSLHSDVS